MSNDKNIPSNDELLVTAAQAYPRMEELVLSAADRLDVSLHIFQPTTRCRSDKCAELGLEDWGDLLVHARDRGVTLRLLLNDFDPIGASGFHQQVWQRVRDLCAALDGGDANKNAGTVEIQVAHPGGSSGWAVATAIWPLIRNRTRQLVRSEGKEDMPGLRELLQNRDIARYWPPKMPMTQSFHQKFLIADGARAIVGGLDIDERRYDDPSHDRPADETWHDVTLAIKGDAVPTLARHFAHCWNAAMEEGMSHATAFLSGSGEERWAQYFDVSHIEVDEISQDDPGPDAPLQLVTTYGKPLKRGAFHLGPTPHEKGIENAYLDLIESAEDYIYFETQFLRSTPLRRALQSAAKDKPDLHLIGLLPGAPDAIAFDGDHSWPHRYGEALQAKAVDKLAEAFGERAGFFSLSSPRERDEQSERDALNGMGMVYVHSKVIFADDRLGIVSSANMNGRSMRWDYETGVRINDPDRIARWRKALFVKHLGAASDKAAASSDGSRMLSAWQKAAEERTGLGDDAVGQGAVLYPQTKARRFSRAFPIIPENMV